MQEFVYHMVQKDIVGNKLVALNSFKEKNPALYERYTKKYFDHPERPKLLTKQVPKLNCLWNDVIHFLPLHPNHVYKALKSLDIKILEDLRFFKIPIEKLKDNNNAMYLYSKHKYTGPAEDIDEDEIVMMNTGDYKELTEIPADTIEYYKVEQEKGNKFGMFPYIPHVLSQGEVEIEGLEIINWNQVEPLKK